MSAQCQDTPPYAHCPPGPSPSQGCTYPHPSPHPTRRLRCLAQGGRPREHGTSAATAHEAPCSAKGQNGGDQGDAIGESALLLANCTKMGEALVCRSAHAWRPAAGMTVALHHAARPSPCLLVATTPVTLPSCGHHTLRPALCLLKFGPALLCPSSHNMLHLLRVHSLGAHQMMLQGRPWDGAGLSWVSPGD